MSLPAATTPCTCNHDGLAHAYVRCGCRYEGEQQDEKHRIDDAYHRLFCHTCLKYCSKNQTCPSALPKLSATIVTANPKPFSLMKILPATLVFTFGVFAAARSWIFNGLWWWWKGSAEQAGLSEKQAVFLS